MILTILLVATVLLLCILAENFSDKLGMPALILFMFIGMLFGSDGILKIPFNNYTLANQVCTLALLFIMFYGGFNTKWKLARTVAVKSIALSTIGVVITAVITAAFCIFCLGFSFGEGFLVGAVLSSTDAASVFAILRKKNLNLADGTASLLEVESGSNDPTAYMLTIIGIHFLGKGTDAPIYQIVLLQVFFGILIGIIFAIASIWVLTKTQLVTEGLVTIFMIAMVLLCYGATELVGGNVLLSVYIMGILVGNSPIDNKNILIPFFDGVTSLSQILIFFLLGLLTFPHKMPGIFFMALAITAVLTLIARPVAVFSLLLPLKCSVPQCLLTSFAGLRGASSSVFAIVAVASGATMSHDLFHIVFMVSLVSVAVQGTLLDRVAIRLNMVDNTSDVRKTFNDYQEDAAITLMRLYIPKGHSWENKQIKDVHMPPGSLALMIKRNGKTIITKGDTPIYAEDNIILSIPAYHPGENETLEEISIDSNHKWANKKIVDLHLPPDELIAMIIRDSESIIPDGKTMIYENDVVVTYHGPKQDISHKKKGSI